MIGSKRKTIAIFRELTKEGIPGNLFDRVHAPVGLDIGAITPEEIAVAITAELIAVRRRVERDLPHMSWFHRSQGGAVEESETPEPIEED
jgi:xanthine/CO dehydrogenase XdhC/CoxF family maturation factor